MTPIPDPHVSPNRRGGVEKRPFSLKLQPNRWPHIVGSSSGLITIVVMTLFCSCSGSSSLTSSIRAFTLLVSVVSIQLSLPMPRCVLLWSTRQPLNFGLVVSPWWLMCGCYHCSSPSASIQVVQLQALTVVSTSQSYLLWIGSINLSQTKFYQVFRNVLSYKHLFGCAILCRVLSLHCMSISPSLTWVCCG